MVKKPHPYHHGNLEEALLAAALELVKTVGPEGITMREIARRAGVSHNAPYRHFRDKQELLAAVAATGFDRLTESMTRAAASGSDAGERLRLSGVGYVQFALRYPQHIAIMFDVPKPLEKYPLAHAAGERAFATLLGYIADCQREGILPEGNTEQLALVAWSMVHGVAKLAIGGQLPFARTKEVLAFTGTAVDALMHGMAQSNRTDPPSQHG